MSNKVFLNDYENIISQLDFNKQNKITGNDTNKNQEPNNMIKIIPFIQSDENNNIKQKTLKEKYNKAIKDLEEQNKIETQKNLTPPVNEFNNDAMEEDFSSGLFQEYNDNFLNEENELKNSFDALENDNILLNVGTNSAYFNNKSLNNDNMRNHLTSNNVVDVNSSQNNCLSKYNGTKTIIIGKGVQL